VELELLVFAGVGYLVAAPAFIWHRRDLRSFHRPVWAGYGRRKARLRGAVVCYLALGWPELLMALGWRTSLTRSALMVERDTMREARGTGGVGNAAP
jgi:hypothetical protein